MGSPTVRISDASHRVLRQLADRTGQTMQTILDRALEDYRRKLFLEAVNADFARLQGDPAAWAEVLEERRSLDGTLGDGLDPEEQWSDDGCPLPRKKRKRA